MHSAHKSTLAFTQAAQAAAKGEGEAGGQGRVQGKASCVVKGTAGPLAMRTVELKWRSRGGGVGVGLGPGPEGRAG